MASDLIVHNLSFTYLHAVQPTLRDISFKIEEGSITAVVGQVGAGKSTLFKTFNGLIPAIIPGKVEGEIIVAGQNLQDKDPAYIAQFITLVFDDPILQIFCLVVEEDVAFGPANLNLPRDEIWARVHEALTIVGLDGFEKRNPRSLSGGEQQLLALAGVIAMRPRILALDEPVAMLDPIGKVRVLKAIHNLNKKFRTTILIADSGSDIEDVCEFATEMILLHKGQILGMGRPAELFSHRKLIEKTKLKIPSVTRLAYELDALNIKKEVPVTLNASRGRISSLLDTIGWERDLKMDLDASRTLASNVYKSPKPAKAIEIKNLHHVFSSEPPVQALKGINLNIEEGDFVALLGQNGSGKTTLSYHMVGVLKPTNEDARIRIAGMNVLNESMFNIVQKINYVFQNPSNQLFCQHFSDEVTFGPRSIGANPIEAEEQGRKALRQVGLEHLWDYFTYDLDRALETLLSLASVLAMEPVVLIADEPTGGLDYEAGEKVMDILQEYNRHGKTIIFITHDMELAAKYAKRIVILRNGEIWMDGTPREVFSQPERLAFSQLSPPQITRLAQSLTDYGFPPDVLDVEEFITILKPHLLSSH